MAVFVSAMVGYGGQDGTPVAVDYPAISAQDQVAQFGYVSRFQQIEDRETAVVEVQAPPAPTATPEPWATMVAREGDSFNSLAEYFGLTATDIASANGVGIDHIFHPGDTLTIPVPVSAFTMPPEIPLYVYEEPVVAEEPVYEEPVAEPTAAPIPPPAPVSGPEDVVAAICSLPWPCETMVRIASCESGLNPNSMNPAGYYGIFQIAGYFDGWNDPWINARVAYEQKYLPALSGGGDGLSPWPHCRYY